MSADPADVRANTIPIGRNRASATLAAETAGDGDLPCVLRFRFDATSEDDIKRIVITAPVKNTPLEDFESKSLTDSIGRTWVLTRRAVTETTFTATTTEGVGGSVRDWSLEAPIALTLPAGERAINGLAVRVGAAARQSFPELAVAVAGSKPILPSQRRVWLEPNCDANTPVPYGTLVQFICRIDGSGKAMLSGNLDGGNSRIVQDKAEVNIWALSPTRYTLTVKFDDGKTESASLFIDVSLPQQGVKLLVHPRTVLPGGPVAMIYTGVNVSSLSIDIRAENAPPTARRPPTIDNSRVRESNRRTFRRSYSVPFGPQGPNEIWTFTARPAISHQFTSNQALRQEAVVNVLSYVRSHAAIELPKSFTQMACGVYVATFNLFGTKQEVVEAQRGVGRRAMWVALAGPDGLKVLTYYEAQRRAVEETPPLEDVGKLAAVTAAGDPAHCRTIVAASWTNKRVELFRLDAMRLANANFTGQAVKPESLVGIDTDTTHGVRLLSLGRRIYVLGGEKAHSFLLPDTAGQSIVVVEEPELAAVLRPHWRLTASPGEQWQVGEGCLYALDTRTGVFLRFDALATQVVQASSQGSRPTLGKPAAASSANKQLAKLDLLAWAQSRITDEAVETIDLQALTEGGGKDSQAMWKFVAATEGGRASSEADPGCVDSRTSLVAVAGAIVARCKLPDNVDPVAPVLQDRAYDPSLNVWTRCGHLFPPSSGLTEDDDEGSLVACVTPGMHIPNADQAVRETEGEDDEEDEEDEEEGRLKGAADASTWFFCYRPKTGRLYRLHVDGVLEALGFNTAELTPNPMLKQAQSAWLGVRLARDGVIRPGQFMTSPNSAYALTLDDGGKLQFVQRGAEADWTPEDWARREFGRWAPEVKVLWSLDTAVTSGGFLKLGSNGDLVLSKDAATPLWSSVGQGGGNSIEGIAAVASQQGMVSTEAAEEERGIALAITDDGRLRVTTASGVELWRAPRVHDGEVGLRPGEWLVPGDVLIRGSSRLTYTTEGDLVAKYGRLVSPYAASGPWKVSGKGQCRQGRLVFGRDGFLRLYPGDSSTPVWNSAEATVTPALVAFGALGQGRAPESVDSEFSLAVLKIVDAGAPAVISRSGLVLWRAPVCWTELRGGDYMLPGDTLVDLKTPPNRLTFTPDGRLTLLTGSGETRWVSESGGDANAVVLRETGALEVYDRKTPEPAWTSLRRGSFSASQAETLRLRIAEEDNQPLLQVTDHFNVIWLSAGRLTGLHQGTTLTGGQYIESPGQTFALVMDMGGVLQLWKGRKLVWASSETNLGLPPAPPNRSVFNEPGWAAPDMKLTSAGVIRIESSRGGWRQTYTAFPTFEDGNSGAYLDRGATLEMNDQGFTVYSGKGGGSRVAWYSVGDLGSGFPAAGRVHVTNRVTCRLFNNYEGIKGYMFAHGTFRESGGRVVCVEKGGGGDFNDNVWIIEEIEPGRFSIFNKHHREYLYISGHNFDDYRRKVLYGPASSVFPNTDELCGLFEFDSRPMVGGAGHFKSVKPFDSTHGGKYIYAATYGGSGNTLRVFGWNAGHAVENGLWEYRE